MSLGIKLATIKDDVNSHFDKKKDWPKFISKLKSKKFRQEASAHPKADDKLRNFITNVTKHQTGEIIHHAPSSSGMKTYDIKKHPDGSMTCSCEDYKYKQSAINGTCKHIEKFKGIEKRASAYVTPYQQKDLKACSAACLKMVLGYYGTNKSEEELKKVIGVHSSGAEVTEITAACKKLGFKAFDKEFSIESARKCVNAGIPIIMDGKSYNHPGKGHYTVLCNIKNGKAHIADPNTPGNKRVISLEELEDRWTSKEMYSPHRAKKRWGIAIIPNEEQTN